MVIWAIGGFRSSFRNLFWLMKGCKSTQCLSGHTALPASTTSTVCCWDWETELLVKSTCTVRAAQCCRQMKPSVVPVPAPASKLLKTFWEENCMVAQQFHSPSLCDCRQGCPWCLRSMYTAIICRQAGVHPAIWPPVALNSDGGGHKDAFKISGKSLWYCI